MGQRRATDAADFPTGFAKVAEQMTRCYGTSPENAYGATVFEVFDWRTPRADIGGSLLIMHSGVQIGRIGGKPSDGVVGSTLEVNCADDRPVILRRPNADATQPIALAFAGGDAGAPAQAANTLGLIKAQMPADGSLRSRVEIQTNADLFLL
jgi:hypothetical protein